MSEPLVEVENLKKYFYENDSILDRLLGDDPVAVKAVDDVSFDVWPGETLGLVGESGCGKSTTGETLLRLLEPTEGAVRFDDTDVFELSGAELTAFRRNAQIVFQDPFSSLDPRMTIGETVKQPLDVHDWPFEDVDSPKERRKERVKDLLERVGLSRDQFGRYPHEFSGGQRQRVGIARALALDPDFIVLDEPTSALDVSVQAQILNLLADLQEELGLTYLLISHDLSVIRHICDRVAVMYLGEIVEIGPSDQVFADPQHPYTEALLDSVPRASVDEQDRERQSLTGDVPSPRNPPSGCRFRTRCPQIIPPERVDLPQEAYREVITLRDTIRSRDISVEGIRDLLDSQEDESTDKAVVDHIYELQFDVDLPSADRKRVRDSLSAVVQGDWEDAEETLSLYRSVCEEVSPKLQDTDQPAACHRRDQPEDVQSAVRELDLQPTSE